MLHMARSSNSYFNLSMYHDIIIIALMLLCYVTLCYVIYVIVFMSYCSAGEDMLCVYK